MKKEIKSENLAKPQIKKDLDVFDIQTMNDLMSEKIVPPKFLIGDLVYPEEVTLLFGRGQVGKSLLANKFADSISKGIDLDLGNDIILINECNSMSVIFYDFELSKGQVQNRFNENIKFKNFHRATLKRGEYLSDNPKEVVNKLVIGAKKVDAKCIIIDNISAISGDIEKSKNAVEFMQALMSLAKNEKYTIIVIAHSPKLPLYVPMSIEHVAGSNKINQLSDSIIGIGIVNVENADEYYIIHLKGRNGSKTYHKGNVIHSVIEKVNGDVRHIAQSIRPEVDLLVNVDVNTEYAPNREFFTYAYLYYGAYRKASDILIKSGVNAPFNTINHNVKIFIEIDPKKYKEIEEYNADDLKALLESKSPLDDCLPLRDGHIPKDNLTPF